MSALLYFAYGSDMHPVQMEERVGEVEPVGIASIRGYRLTFNKRGNDGSGKCNLIPTGRGTDRVMGVAYSVSLEQFKDLIQVASGYRASAVTIELDSRVLPAASFVARSGRVDDNLQPFDWYKQLVLRGLEHFEFPVDYCDSVRQVISVPDSEESRVASIEQTLARSHKPVLV